MSRRPSLTRLFGARASAASLAVVAGLAVLMAAPSPVFAWTSGTLSSTEEEHMVTLINQYRVSLGLAALTVDSTDRADAEWRVQQLYNYDCFSHFGPTSTGSCPSSGTFLAQQYLDSHGYCWTAVAENIAWNNWPDTQTTQAAFDGWKGSPSHDAIMRGSYTRIGIGVFKGTGRWATTSSGPFYNATTNYYADTTSDPVKMFAAVFTVPCAAATSSPKPTPTPTPKPTPTPTPRPTATPTPRPTATPTPPPAGGATPAPSDAPGPGATGSPGVTAQPSLNAGPGPTAAVVPSFDTATGGGGDVPANLRIWKGGRPGDAGAVPPSEPPGGPPAPRSPDSGTGPVGLQVVEPLPAVDLLDAVVGGVAGTFFGS
jgi:uncharacterized protein YkwD